MKIKDIGNRSNSYSEITKELWRSEHGIRAICVMYDEHSKDKNSHENIVVLKENIQYRLFSAAHQYLILLRELGEGERYLSELKRKETHITYPFGNPHIDKVELEISSIFDSIIFHLSSVFDYLSHFICYICHNNKSNTFYWTSLANSARGTGNEISQLEMKTVIVSVDKKFVGKLYDYRSRLIHNKRDKHRFMAAIDLQSNHKIKILASAIAKKHFNMSAHLKEDEEPTIVFMASQILKNSFDMIEELLDGLLIEIKKTSVFWENLRVHPKKGSLPLLSYDPKTRTAKPISEGLWEEYKKKYK